jgi:hypothetical protein
MAMPMPLEKLPGLQTMTVERAIAQWTMLGDDLAFLPNSEEPYPPFDVVSLAPKRATLEGGCAAVLLDMDGTLTTTEPFTCAAMEAALRRMMGSGGAAWPGLDAQQDHPALIGYSGADNMRYLHARYGQLMEARASALACLEAAHWVFGPEADPATRDGVRGLMEKMGWGGVLEDSRFQEGGSAALNALSATLPLPPVDRLDLFGPMGLTVYVHEYHALLARLEEEPPGALIGPMPGAAELLALISGSLGAEAGALAEQLGGYPGGEERLTRLGEAFAAAPAKTALVTSSTAFEAGHALSAVFRAARKDVMDWPVRDETRAHILARFQSPASTFDVVITSSDLPPFAFKPRRDPYALALRRLGVGESGLTRVIGFEDTAPGIIALRGAGVGCAVALPFTGTAAHDFSVAAAIAQGGLPQVLAQHGLYLSGMQ